MADNNLTNLEYCLDCGSKRLDWYIDTGNERYLEDSRNYLTVANIFMKRIMETTNEIRS